MTLDPNSLVTTPDLLERIEMASLRLVAQALYEFKKDAVQIFAIEQDRVKTIGEDITRECRPSAIMGHVRGVENPRV